jgi:hypothetical protein
MFNKETEKAQCRHQHMSGWKHTKNTMENTGIENISRLLNKKFAVGENCAGGMIERLVQSL